MTAEQYLTKCKEICKWHESKECKTCPLLLHGCGLPGKRKDIGACIKAVEDFGMKDSKEPTDAEKKQ